MTYMVVLVGEHVGRIIEGKRNTRINRGLDVDFIGNVWSPLWLSVFHLVGQFDYLLFMSVCGFCNGANFTHFKWLTFKELI